MEIRVVEITPSLAEEWLEKTGASNFRSPGAAFVLHLSRQILGGRFHLNGETIKIRSDGTVADGMHRLHAVVKAGKPILSAVAFGADDNFGVDEGRSRTNAQWLASKGYKNSSTLATTLSLVRLLELGKGGVRGGTGPAYRLTPEEIIQMARTHACLPDYVRAADKARRVVSVSLVAAVTYLGSSSRLRTLAVEKGCVQSETVTAFIDGVATGVDLEADDPCYLLREKMIRDKQEMKTRMHPVVKRASTILAWNKFVAGEACTGNSLRFRQVGPHRQKFPQISVTDE